MHVSYSLWSLKVAGIIYRRYEQHTNVRLCSCCEQGYHSGIIRNCTSKGVDHAVLMVAAGEEGGVPYFTIKNSWGTKVSAIANEDHLRMSVLVLIEYALYLTSNNIDIHSSDSNILSS